MGLDSIWTSPANGGASLLGLAASARDSEGDHTGRTFLTPNWGLATINDSGFF